MQFEKLLTHETDWVRALGKRLMEFEDVEILEVYSNQLIFEYKRKGLVITGFWAGIDYYSGDEAKLPIKKVGEDIDFPYDQYYRLWNNISINPFIEVMKFHWTVDQYDPTEDQKNMKRCFAYSIDDIIESYFKKEKL